MKLKIVLEKNKLNNPIYSAYCRELNCFSQGRTIKSALKNIGEAIELHLMNEKAYCENCSFKCIATGCECICHNKKTAK